MGRTREDERQRSAKKAQERQQYWDAIAGAFREWLENNPDKIPSRSYESPNFPGIKLGKLLNNWRSRGLPEDCPSGLKKTIEENFTGDRGKKLSAANEAALHRRTSTFWTDVESALVTYYSYPQNIGTVPPSSYADPVNNTNLGRLLTSWRSVGIPKDCPQQTREYLEGYLVVGDPGKQIAAQQGPYSASRARRQAAVSSGGTQAAQSSTGGSKRYDPEFWSEVERALVVYYSNDQNIGTVPPKTYVDPYNPSIKLGALLTDWRRRGVPTSCPPATEEFIRGYNLLGDEGKQAAASQKPNWVAGSTQRGGTAGQAGSWHPSAASLTSPLPALTSSDGSLIGNAADLIREPTPPGYRREYAGTDFEILRPITAGPRAYGNPTPAPAPQATVSAFDYAIDPSLEGAMPGSDPSWDTMSPVSPPVTSIGTSSMVAVAAATESLRLSGVPAFDYSDAAVAPTENRPPRQRHTPPQLDGPTQKKSRR